jgi:hypothetical protein
MKSKILFACFIVMLLTAACYDETDPVVEIITEGNGHYPVSANTFVDLTNMGSITTNRIYAPGTDISFELQYWSEDPIQEINLYSTVGNGLKTRILNEMYSEVAAFSELKSADTLVLKYKMPLILVETTIKLDVEIVNQNGLTLTRSITLKDKP